MQQLIACQPHCKTWELHQRCSGCALDKSISAAVDANSIVVTVFMMWYHAHYDVLARNSIQHPQAARAGNHSIQYPQQLTGCWETVAWSTAGLSHPPSATLVQPTWQTLRTNDSSISDGSLKRRRTADGTRAGERRHRTRYNRPIRADSGAGAAVRAIGTGKRAAGAAGGAAGAADRVDSAAVRAWARWDARGERAW